MPLDQDLMFGRAALEAVRLYDGIPFRLEAKLSRLARSAELLGLPPVEPSRVGELVEQVATEAAGDALVRFYWTSGQGPGDDPLERRELKGRALAIALPLPAHLEQLRSRGLRLVSLAAGVDASLRAALPWLLPGAKVSGSAAASAAWIEARRRGADDGILVDLHGRVLEGPATNIWWRSDRTLFTPSAELGILPGITSAVIRELAEPLGYEVSDGSFALSDLSGAEEAFVTSTVAEVVGVVELDGRPIGDGRVGPAARELHLELRHLAGASA